MSLPIVIRRDQHHIFESAAARDHRHPLPAHQVRYSLEGNRRLRRADDGHPLDRRAPLAHRRVRGIDHALSPDAGARAARYAERQFGAAAGMRHAMMKAWKGGLVAGLLLRLASRRGSRAGHRPGHRLPARTGAGRRLACGKKVAVSFALFVETFGFGQGPVFRPDLATRNPDLVNEAFRQYADRLGHPARRPAVQGARRSAHHGAERGVSRRTSGGMEGIPRLAADCADHRPWHEQHQPLMPIGRGVAEQRAYVRQTLDTIAAATGAAPTGWSIAERLCRPRYHAGDRRRGHHLHDRPDGFRRHRAAEDAGRSAGAAAVSGRHRRHGPSARTHEDAAVRSRRSGSTTCSELAHEARADPSRAATTVVIGIHPFVIGTPDGAAALRRVLTRLKTDDAVWLTDTAAILGGAEIAPRPRQTSITSTR